MYEKNYKYKSLFDLWKKTCGKYQDNIAFTDNINSIEITYKQAFNELCFFNEKLSKQKKNVFTFFFIFLAIQEFQLLLH